MSEDIQQPEFKLEDLSREELEIIAATKLSAEDIAFMEGEEDIDFIGYVVGTLEAEHGVEDGAAYLIEQGAIIGSRLHEPEIKDVQNRGEPFSTKDIDRLSEKLKEGST